MKSLFRHNATHPERASRHTLHLVASLFGFNAALGVSRTMGPDPPSGKRRTIVYAMLSASQHLHCCKPRCPQQQSTLMRMGSGVREPALTRKAASNSGSSIYYSFGRAACHQLLWHVMLVCRETELSRSLPTRRRVRAQVQSCGVKSLTEQREKQETTSSPSFRSNFQTTDGRQGECLIDKSGCVGQTRGKIERWGGLMMENERVSCSNNPAPSWLDFLISCGLPSRNNTDNGFIIQQTSKHAPTWLARPSSPTRPCFDANRVRQQIQPSEHTRAWRHNPTPHLRSRRLALLDSHAARPRGRKF